LTENTIKVVINHNKANSEFRVSGQSSNHSNTPIVHDGIGLTVRGFDSHEETGIVIFLDVLGVKGIWNRLPPIKVVNNWKGVIRSLMDSLEEKFLNSRYDLRVLSDTIIITIPCQLDYSIIDTTFDLLLGPFIESIKLGMLLRGTISHGTYYLSQYLIIWKALDDAAENNGKIKWIGVSLSPDLSTKINDIYQVNTHSIFLYNRIPHKEFVYSGFVLNWPIYDSHGECNSALRRQNIQSDPSIKQKHDNTYEFYSEAQRARLTKG
jgi:hypothetical protein